MSGADYGGGINFILSIPRKILNVMLYEYRRSQTKHDYDFYEELRSMKDRYELKVDLG